MHYREREYLTLVRVLIKQSRFDEARQWLTNLLHLAETQGRTGSLIELLMLQAEVSHASGEEKQAREQLSLALTLAQPEGYIRLFVDEGVPIAQILLQMHRRVLPGEQPDIMHYREQLLTLLSKEQKESVSHATDAAPRPGSDSLAEPLSERELEVLRLIVAGYSNREIANRLVIALSTVKWYVNIIYSKLQVESRTKAIARARDLHLM